MYNFAEWHNGRISQSCFKKYPGTKVIGAEMLHMDRRGSSLQWTDKIWISRRCIYYIVQEGKMKPEHDYCEVLHNFFAPLFYKVACIYSLSSTALQLWYSFCHQNQRLHACAINHLRWYFFTLPHAWWQESNCLIPPSIATKCKFIAYQKSPLTIVAIMNASQCGQSNLAIKYNTSIYSSL